MKKFTISFFSFTLLLCFNLAAQKAILSGIISDKASGEPLISATVQIEETGTITDFNGTFELEYAPGVYEIVFSYVGYESAKERIQLKSGETTKVEISLVEETSVLQTATVTSGKFEKPLGEVTVSLEVIKPRLIENTNQTSLSGVLKKVPGVNMIGNQANIRGGSGFSYGAGSRVLLLVDDMPILQADAGFPQWADVPIENVEQIEVVKGAASALYGSSAMNGIINVRTAYAKSKPETKVSWFYNHYLEPADKVQTWWNSAPNSGGLSFSHKQKFGRLDVVTGGYFLAGTNSNKFSYTERGRLNLGLRYRVTDRLSVGINTNYNRSSGTGFFFWGGVGDKLRVPTESTRSNSSNTRYNIDPFVSFYDKGNNRHKIQSRFFKVKNNTGTGEADQSNRSEVYYAEYQFQKKIERHQLVATAGLVYTGTAIKAPLYGDSTLFGRNYAGYAQLDKKFGERLNLSAGFRYESNNIKTPETILYQLEFINSFGVPAVLNDSIFVPNGEFKESKPVFRFGLNYKLSEGTFLRASYGQGYRFPTIAEKYIFTVFGGVPIRPNADLSSETGWSAEIGIKQGFQFLGFQGFADLAGFLTEYQDMMEFTFVNLAPDGFQSQNVGNTSIKGIELSIMGRGKLLGLETDLLMGYTYIDPQFKEFDPEGEPGSEGLLNAKSSSADYNILKYRSKHSIKFDMESRFDKFSVGVGATYSSFMEAIDAIFEAIIVPGLNEYRNELNTNGDLFLSARFSYKPSEQAKISIMGKNLLNQEIVSRPGILENSMNWTLRVDFKF